MEQQLVQPEPATTHTETREKHDFSADIASVSGDGVTVNVARTTLTADATLIQENGEERKVFDFNEETQEAQHTVLLEDTIYEKFRASAWDIVQEIIGEADTSVRAVSDISAWGLVQQLRANLPFPATVSQDILPTVESVEHASSRSTPIELPVYDITDAERPPRSSPRLDTPYERMMNQGLENGPQQLYDRYEEYSRSINAPLPGTVETVLESVPYSADTATDLDAATHDDLNEPLTPARRQVHIVERTTYEETEDDEHGLHAQLSYTATSDNYGSAADVLQRLFTEAGIAGTVEDISYTASEAFVDENGKEWDVGDRVKSAFIDIDDLDMTKTEYFINGELATGAIDAYTLTPGDTITFVEADVFAEYSGVCSGGLELDDILTEQDAETIIETYDAGTDMDYAPATPAYTGS